MTKKQYDLEDRLVEYAASAIQLVKALPSDYGFEILGKQLIRSATSSALNFAETQGTITTKDYIHKASICLKELRECSVNLKIMMKLENPNESMQTLLFENTELVKIVTVIIKNKSLKL
ncbi:MAG: four helix bundle protein [Bacteroidia bacterium]|jgi:four helix bundle protein